MSEKVVIVGAGQAGGELASALRQRGYTGSITLVGEEEHPPYQRPPLSKGFLLGKVARDALYIKPRETYERLDITLRLRTRVESIDRAAHHVVLSDGSSLPYDRLALATGGQARRLTLPGLDLSQIQNVLCLRSLADVDVLRGELLPERRLVLIGGGYVGLEIAAAAVQLGLRVTVVESAPRLLPRVTGPEVSSFIEGVHRAHGVQFRLGAEVRGLALDASQHRAVGVDIACQGVEERIDADLVLVGIGLVPNTALAAAAGLAVDNGIVVDEYARTSDPDILAIGDCANQPSAYTGGRIRLESVPNAIDHARVAAATLAGQPEPSSAVPWFWSEQYDLRLQMVGLSSGYDRCITRGALASRAFAAFYLQGSRILAADVIGRPADFTAARRLVTNRTPVDLDRLADEATPLAQVAA